MQCAECRDMLERLVDDELMPDEARDVREHMATCDDCSREHDSLMTISNQLKENLMRYSAPDVLKARIHNGLTQSLSDKPKIEMRPKQSRWAWLVAAGALIAVASSAVTYSTVTREVAGRSTSDEVLASHVRSLMPGHLTDVASTNQHNVKPWFNGRVNLSPVVPALDSSGFTLVGGRLDYLSGHPVAAVVYGIRQHLINVYSWPDAGSDESPSSETRQGYHLVHWRSGGVGYWVISDLNTTELSRFVSLLRASG
jgi:anti-sigma factor RsiW